MIMYIITSAEAPESTDRAQGRDQRRRRRRHRHRASRGILRLEPCSARITNPDRAPPRALTWLRLARTVDREPSYVDTTLDCYDLRIGYRVAVGRCRRFGGRSRPVVPPRTIRWSPESRSAPRPAGPRGRSVTAAHEQCALLLICGGHISFHVSFADFHFADTADAERFGEQAATTHVRIGNKRARTPHAVGAR